MCLSLTKKQNVKSYVLCAGVLYGEGELGFYEMFKQSWLQEPDTLPVYGKGRNRIPCVHVQDLATFVLKIIERPPLSQYIFGIDQNPKPSQKRIVAAISSGIGSGKLETRAG
jgi:adenylate kinase